MIYFSDKDREKINYLDKIFGGLSVEELKALSEREDIVARLKGEGVQPGVIMQSIVEFQTFQVQFQTLQNDFMAMKADMTTIVKTMVQPFPTNNQNWEFQNLKNRCGIYS